MRIEHVESGDVSDAPQIGDTLTVRAYVALGEVNPVDVVVHVKYGKVDSHDDIHDGENVEMIRVEDYGSGRYRYEATVPLSHSGSHGYTVRIVPQHELLASFADLGLQVVPQ